MKSFDLKSVALAAALLPALGLAPATASAESWTVDTSHSAVSFSVSHLMVSSTKGEFTGVVGRAEIDLRNPTRGQVDVTIDVRSIDTRDEKRDAHLRNADFFDTAKYPTARFRSTKIKRAGQRLKIYGELTLHGVTRRVVLMTKLSKPVDSPWGQRVVGVHATTTIDRREFGISWNKSLDAGGVVVGNEVKLEIDVELHAVKAKAG